MEELENQKRMKMQGRELSREQAEERWHYLFDPWVDEVINFINSKTNNANSYFASRFYSEIIKRLEAMRDGAEAVYHD